MGFWRKGLKRADKEALRRFAGMCRENQVGGRDAFAMTLAAFLVIVLPCLGVLLALGGGVLLLFGALA